jgi:Mn-dependent DtxR family transcriptional regulator
MKPDQTGALVAPPKSRRPGAAVWAALFLSVTAFVAMTLAVNSFLEKSALLRTQAELVRTATLAKELAVSTPNAEERIKRLREADERDARQLQKLRERRAELEPLVKQAEWKRAKKAELAAELRILSETDEEALAILKRNGLLRK